MICMIAIWSVVCVQAGGALALMYFVLFTVIASFIVLSLFVGVVTTSMFDAQRCAAFTIPHSERNTALRLLLLSLILGRKRRSEREGCSGCSFIHRKEILVLKWSAA